MGEIEKELPVLLGKSIIKTQYCIVVPNDAHAQPFAIAKGSLRVSCACTPTPYPKMLKKNKVSNAFILEHFMAFSF
ncbi:MAG: hypothetical protein EBR54_07540 [Flavobacteriia bacterium]|nr:hypothetical protein [Flavobacteriia bacterium]